MISRAFLHRYTHTTMLCHIWRHSHSTAALSVNLLKTNVNPKYLILLSLCIVILISYMYQQMHVKCIKYYELALFIIFVMLRQMFATFRDATADKNQQRYVHFGLLSTCINSFVFSCPSKWRMFTETCSADYVYR